MPYYAVANGRAIGVFTTWSECNMSVKGYKNAAYKKFDTKQEAEEFVSTKGLVVAATAMKASSNDDLGDFQPDYYVYTDGACSKNGTGDASAGIGIFFGENDPRNVSAKLLGKQTNNLAELTAIVQAHDIIQPDISTGKKVVIVTDSEYAIKCVSTYGEKCYKQNWNVDIPNKDLVKTAYELYKDISNSIRFKHIRAHTQKTDIHSIGNDHADILARMHVY
jgi:ribonuclease HI